MTHRCPAPIAPAPIVLALIVLALAAPAARAMTREELCHAHAYNFAVLLGLREQGASRAEAREMLSGMIEGADRRITGAVDRLLADAWAWRGHDVDAAEQDWRRRCLAG